MQKNWNASRHFANTLSLAVLLAICTVAAAIGAAELSKQQSLAELEGTWTLVTANMSGQPLLAKDQQPPEITIKNGILTSDFKRAASELPLDLTKVVDPFKSPKIITLPVLRRITFNGIYEVRNAELRNLRRYFSRSHGRTSSDRFQRQRGGHAGFQACASAQQNLTSN